MPRKSPTSAAIVVLAALLPVPALAQPAVEGSSALVPGARIRVTVVNPPPSGVTDRTIVGVFSEWDAGTLRLAASQSQTQELPQAAIVRLERSVRPSRKTRGALVGFAVGLAAAVGKAGLQGGCNDGCNEANVAAALLVALSGATLGAIAAPGEGWADVALEHGPNPTARREGRRVQLVPQVGRGLGLTVVARF